MLHAAGDDVDLDFTAVDPEAGSGKLLCTIPCFRDAMSGWGNCYPECLAPVARRSDQSREPQSKTMKSKAEIPTSVSSDISKSP